MYLSSWFKRWAIAVLISLFAMVGCGAYLFLQMSKDQNDSDSKYVINRVRLEVSSVMLYLEDHVADLVTNKAVLDTVQSMTEDRGLGLIVAGLDGTVLFNSDVDAPTQQTLNLKNDVHYDLYTSKMNNNLFKIAFPIVDAKSHAQAGNAIFTLPKTMVYVEPPDNLPVFIFLIMISILVLLILLIVWLRYKLKYEVIQPVRQLKSYSESILKGDYTQKASYARANEIGEFYATFDQMRLEIMFLSKQRKEHEQEQKELISNISHDIKTPLTTLKAYIEAIQSGVCSDMDEVMEYAKVMRNNTDKMTRLVEDLLNHALQELGQISVNRKEQYSRNVFLSILQPIGHYVQTTGVTFHEPKEQDIPNVLFQVDAGRLEQVFSNLITNGLKHTSPGESISVRIDQQLKQLMITIADTGEGILPEDMPFVFERYFKGHTKTTRTNNGSEPTEPAKEKPGTGLGLSICKTIIEAHGGDISFKSARGQGTVFYFTLPIS